MADYVSVDSFSTTLEKPTAEERKAKREAAIPSDAI